MNRDLQSIVTLLQHNRAKEARKACAAYLKHHGNDADGWFVHAGICSHSGDMDSVIESCRRALTIQPTHVGAAFNLGVALQRQGHIHDAVNAYRTCLSNDKNNRAAKENLSIALTDAAMMQYRSGDPDAAWTRAREAVDLNPDSAEAHACLALVANARMAPEECERHFKTALQLKPDFPQALNNLGSLYASTQRPEEAVQHFEKAVRLLPGYADAYNNMGLTFQKINENEKACYAFQQAVRIAPDNAEYRNNLGNAYLVQKKVTDAVDQFRHAVRLSPDFWQAHNNLGNALLMREDHRRYYEEAESCYRKTMALNPKLAEAHFNLGTCLHPQAKYAEALEEYETAIKLQPEYEDAIAAKSTVLERMGRFDEAWSTITTPIERGSTNINLALAFGSLAKRYDRKTQAAALIKGILDTKADTRSQNEAHFLLGKLYDSEKEYDTAFHHFRLANSISPPPYTHQETLELHCKLQKTFSRDKQERAAKASNGSETPVFIVGMPRSGTSLVEQILSSHSQVFGAGELEDIGNITENLSREVGLPTPYPECVELAGQDTLDTLADRYLSRLHTLGGNAKRVTDKMPHNFQALGLIERLFPGARVIHCVRDPVDTCLSIYFQHFNAYHAYACDLHSLGIYYLEYLKLMEFWKTNLTLPLLEIRYEAMVEDQEATSRKMIDFIGLDWEESCLNFHQSDRFVATPSYDQVRQPIYRKSLERWKNYEKHLGPLLSALSRQQDA